MPLQTLFNEAHNLPNIPKVVQELIDNFNNPDSNAEDIARKLQMDQVLSAKVLRLANSARYGAGRKVASIDSAIVLLGFDAIKTLVVASGVTGAFKAVPGLDKKAFWRDCFMTASIARLVAGAAHQDRETGFTCGMLHNIGQMLIHIVHTDKAARIETMVAEGASRVDLQRNQFGCDYAQASAELAKRWNFPQNIVTALAQQEDPLSHEEFSPLSGVVAISKYLNKALQNQWSKEEVLKHFPNRIAEQLDIDLLTFFEKLVEMADAEDDIEELLS